jgi:hypothetical protein
MNFENFENFQKIKGHFELDRGAKVYDEVSSKLPDNANIVELGCYLGKSTYYLIQKLKERKIKFNLDVVDVFENNLNTDNRSKYKDNFLDIFKNNMGSDLSYIKNIHKNYTSNAANLYEDNSLDFIYVDASHKEDDVLNDILLWFPKLKSGGIMAGDDWQKVGVRNAVVKVILNSDQCFDCHPYSQQWSKYKYDYFEQKYFNQWMIKKH